MPPEIAVAALVGLLIAVVGVPRSGAESSCLASSVSRLRPTTPSPTGSGATSSGSILRSARSATRRFSTSGSRTCRAATSPASTDPHDAQRQRIGRLRPHASPVAPRPSRHRRSGRAQGPHDRYAEPLRQRQPRFAHGRGLLEEYRDHHGRWYAYQESQGLLRHDPSADVYRVTAKVAWRGVANFANPLADNFTLARFGYLPLRLIDPGLQLVLAVWMALVADRMAAWRMQRELLV